MTADSESHEEYVKKYMMLITKLYQASLQLVKNFEIVCFIKLNVLRQTNTVCDPYIMPHFHICWSMNYESLCEMMEVHITKG